MTAEMQKLKRLIEDTEKYLDRLTKQARTAHEATRLEGMDIILQNLKHAFKHELKEAHNE